MADPIVKAAKAQAQEEATAADVAADTARELLELASVPMKSLTRPAQDVLGRDLPEDDDEARAQQREAALIREQRIAIDVARTQRGLPTKYAAE
jgi:hypothetical protein